MFTLSEKWCEYQFRLKGNVGKKSNGIREDNGNFLTFDIDVILGQIIP